MVERTESDTIRYEDSTGFNLNQVIFGNKWQIFWTELDGSNLAQVEMWGSHIPSSQKISLVVQNRLILGMKKVMCWAKC